MEFLKNIKDWLSDNWGWILVLSILITTVVTDIILITSKTKATEEIVACETMCFPQQSEYLKHGDAHACWCYVDSETIKKSQ